MDQIAMIIGTITIFAVGAYILWGPSSPERRQRGTVIGLANLGNTCFMNATLQALASCPLLLEWMRSEPRTDQAIINALKNTILIINGQVPCEAEYYTPTELLKALHNHNWVITTNEEDAHELFYALISSMKDEVDASIIKRASILDALADPAYDENYRIQTRASLMTTASNSSTQLKAEEMSPKPDNFDYFKNAAAALPAGAAAVPPAGAAASASYPSINDPMITTVPFQGFVTIRRMCMVCGHKTPVEYDKFNSVSLPLPKKESLPNERLTLSHLIENYTGTEIVNEVECKRCSEDLNGSSSVKTTAVKMVAFGMLPKCLCFHIQRTDWQQGSQAKRCDYVDFPEFLSMDPYINQLLKTKSSLGVCCDPESAKAESKKQSNNKVKNLYRLAAVVVHEGGLERGHFIAYRRSPTQAHQWYFTSDRRVTEASLQEVMQACAYMLFYCKVKQRKSSAGCSVTSLFRNREANP